MAKLTLRRALVVVLISAIGLLFSMWILVTSSAAQEEEREAIVAATRDPDGQSLLLEENVGQFDRRGRFLLRHGSGRIWLTEDGIWIALQDQQALHQARASWLDGERIDRLIPAVNIKLRFLGADPTPAMEPFYRQDARFSYLVGDDQADWFTSIPVWGGVRYRDLYPGVDLVISADKAPSNGALLPWHLELDRDADLAALELSIEGVEGLTLGSDQIRLQTVIGSFALPLLKAGHPASFDSAVSALALTEPEVRQSGPEAFVIDSPLTSDASLAAQSSNVLTDTGDLIYSTYLGGGDTDAANGVAVDEAGAIYVVGNTSSADFPTVPGSYDTTLNSQDVYVAKIDPAGTGSSDLIYATFIGGSTLDFGLSIDESAGQAFITGETISNDFPTTSGAFDTTCGDDALCDGHTDAFITQLNAAGTDLAYSSYLGASHDDRGNGITISGGELYIAGTTKSDNFPTTANALDRTCGTDGTCNRSSGQVVFSDAFFVKFLPAGNGSNDLLYGTFLGGRSRDLGNDVAASGGDGFVTGRSESFDFPATGYVNGNDAFVVRIDPAGNNQGDRVYGTFLGSQAWDVGNGIDTSGSTAYVVGETEGADFPATEGAINGDVDSFLALLDGTGAITYASFIGGSGEDIGSDVAVEKSGVAILTGYTESADFPVTAEAYDTALSGASDAYVVSFKLDSTDPQHINYATYLGGSTLDEAYGLAIDEEGHAYIAGATNSSDFPTTAGAFDTALDGVSDAILSKLLVIPPPGIDIEKSTNGHDADEPPGPYLTVGSPITWRYVITNTGGVTLTNIQVNDDQLGSVCSLASMAPDDTLTCNKTGAAGPDQYFNAATVTADAPPELDLDPISDIDLSHYFGAMPRLDLQKYTNDHKADEAPGPFIRVGHPVTWTYVVTNTGNVRLTGIVVTDSLEGPALCNYDFLERNQQATCVITATAGALTGQYANTGFARATPPGGLAEVTDQDVSHYFGADPSVSMLKLTNDQIVADMPGPYVLVNDPVTWTYIITNTGNVTVSVSAVIDDQGVAVTCPNPEVPVDSWTTCAGSDLATAGQYTNTAEVQAAPPVGDDVTAVDSSHYYGVDPAVLIKKLTNGQDAGQPPGPFIPEGDPVAWTYIVTNTGNISLTAVTVTDNQGVSVSCDPAPISPGQARICTGSGTAVSGQYSNTAMALATPLFGPDVTWSDDSYYYGSSPDITVVKRTNGVLAESEPGPYIQVGDPVTWTYEVSNSGNITLTGIVVTDDKLGPISCASEVLGQGQSTSCLAAGVAAAGQYSNTVAAVGVPPVGQNVTGTGMSYYYGVDAEISLKKLTNGQPGDSLPGPYVTVGDPVTWTFIVSNTGNSTLTGITLTDDQLGDVDCPLDVLASDQQMSCEVIGAATAGQHTNTATVQGTPPVGPNVPAQDTSHYFGVDPHVAIKKFTNGDDAPTAPGPYILENDPVSWTYAVTNTGNITLTNVTVTDSKGEEVTCPQSSLDLDAAMICTAASVAGSGQYSNTAQVTAMPLFGPQVEAVDTSYYFGMSPALQLTKRTNDQVARIAPGPYILVDDPVTWTFAVTNSGNITLSAISLVDDQLGSVLCPEDVLGAGEAMTCRQSELAAAGQYSNTATVTGAPAPNAPSLSGPRQLSFAPLARLAPAARRTGEVACPFDLLTAGQDTACMPAVSTLIAQVGDAAAAPMTLLAGGEVTATDISHYFGADPIIVVKKTTNGLLAGRPPGPIVDFNAGDIVTWTVVVSNTGNVPLEAVALVDDHGTPAESGDDFDCDFGLMAAGGPAKSCTYSAVAGAGQYSNIASVSATPPGGLADISSQAVSHYFGSDPSILLTKYTNGVDVQSPPGPVLIIDRTVVWTYEVRNTGNYTLTQLIVVDQEGDIVDPGLAVTVCEIEALGPGLTELCTLPGIVVSGQYTNTAAVTGLPPIGDAVADQDSSHYYGARGLFIPLIRKN